MRYIIIVAIAVIGFSCGQNNQKQDNSSASVADNQLSLDTIHIGKMHCEMCVASVEKGVQSVEGVEYVKAVLEDSIAVVRYNSSETNLREIHGVIVKRGYTIKEDVTNP